MAAEQRRIPFVRPDRPSAFNTLKGVNRSVYTLFATPKHEKLHAEVAELTKCEIQPLQPPIPDLINEMSVVTMELVDPSLKRGLTNTELAQAAGVLIQFTDYTPELQQYANTPYAHIDALHNSIIERASQRSGPLSFAEQLDVALRQTEGDLPESLWRLFMTSRLNARWLDGKSIDRLPDFSHEEKVDRMVQWQRALRACKTNDEGFQDVGGDTYYAWTHALASVIFEALPVRSSKATQYAAKTFQNGTEIMRRVIHKVSPQAVINNHNAAGNYGNAMGRVCVDKLLSG